MQDPNSATATAAPEPGPQGLGHDRIPVSSAEPATRGPEETDEDDDGDEE